MKALVAIFFAGILAEPAIAQDDCVHRAFDRFCLGGEIEPIIETLGIHLEERDGPTRSAMSVEANPTMLIAYDGRLGAVAKVYMQGGKERFEKLRKEIEAVHGTGEDTSDGQDQVLGWDRGDWRIALVLDDDGQTMVGYYHKELDAKIKKHAAKSK